MMKKFLFRLADVVFWVALVALLLGGLAVILGQTVGVFISDGALMESMTDDLGPWVFTSATVCGIAAFVLQYRRTGAGDSAPDRDAGTD